MPSRAFTVTCVGGCQPAATSREMSAFSSDNTTRPLLSRSTKTGGVTGVEDASMNDAPSGDIEI